MPEPAHEDLVLLREGRVLGKEAGELGARAAHVVVVEEEVVEDRELVVCLAGALEDLVVQVAQTGVAALWGVGLGVLDPEGTQDAVDEEDPVKGLAEGFDGFGAVLVVRLGAVVGREDGVEVGEVEHGGRCEGVKVEGQELEFGVTFGGSGTA